MSKMSRLAVEELEKRGIDPDQAREEAYIEKQHNQRHVDLLIKEIQNCDAHLRLYVESSVYNTIVQLLTALRDYNIVPEQPKPVMLQPEDGEEVLF